MNAEDLYIGREDLMTSEELEDIHHDPSTETIPTYTPILRQWILFGNTGNEDDDSGFGMRPTPEDEYRHEFENRPPAMGATPLLLNELRTHHVKLPPVQQRLLYRSVRYQMLRQLISCDGAETINDLLGILQKEMESGTPAPVPDWYEYSTVRMGPRKIGYDGCSNRGCYHTEVHDKPRFSRCSKCKVAIYCSRDCQATDWKARHKKVCKGAAEQREKIIRVSQMMQGMSGMMGGR